MVSDEIDRFTVGRDRELDLYRAPFDVLGNLAHAQLLSPSALLPPAEYDLFAPELRKLYQKPLCGRWFGDGSGEEGRGPGERGPSPARGRPREQVEARCGEARVAI